MSRIMGIDYGDARIGVSVSDPIGIIASDLCVIQNTGIEDVILRFKELVEEYDISKFVVGLPLNMNDSEGFQAQKVRAFAKELEVFNKPIIFVDERLSSQKAESILKELKVDKKTIRYTSDSKAASIILQDYLDYN